MRGGAQGVWLMMLVPSPEKRMHGAGHWSHDKITAGLAVHCPGVELFRFDYRTDP